MTVMATPLPGRRPAARRWTAASATSSSPSATRPVRSTARTRSPSPSNAKPMSWPPVRICSAISSGCVEPQPALMLRPSGRSPRDRDVGAEVAEDRRRRAVGRAVGAVEQDAHAREVQTAEARTQRGEVVVERVAGAADAPDRGRAARDSRRLELALDRLLGLVGELVARRAEELDAVVVERVV